MAEPPAQAEAPRLFPIQLRRVDVSDIHYSCGGFPIPTLDPITEYNLETGLSPIDEKTKSFQVSLRFSTENKPEASGIPLPYSLSIQVHADYAITGEFPQDKLVAWATLNGTAVLMPFLREVVHTITARTGFKPYVMPLVEAPLYRVERPPGGIMPTGKKKTAGSAAIEKPISRLT